jgi:nucleoside-diphosphate-sugar epimerase
LKVVVTGGAGFLGQRLIAALLKKKALADTDGSLRAIGEVVALDQVAARPVPGVRAEIGDVSDPELLRRHCHDADSVFHLAAVVSGAAEADYELGMRINVDATRALLEVLRTAARKPKLVFASSVAVFGGDLPHVVSDDTAPTPQSSYGVQKLISELLISDCTRRGMIDGRAVRLPTIVVRPGKPNAAASSFASGIIREPLAGVMTDCPVAPEASLWISSPATAISNLIHGHELPADVWRARRALNLPGLTITVNEMLAALEAVGGAAARARVTMRPDARIRAIVDTWPARFATVRADALGFARDADFDAIVRDYAREFAGDGQR